MSRVAIAASVHVSRPAAAEFLKVFSRREYSMAMTTSGSVPDAGGDAVPGGYGAPTPHAAVAAHTPYEAPTSVPSTNPPASSTGAYDVIEDGLGEAKPV
jgi:hypothetical protein